VGKIDICTLVPYNIDALVGNIDIFLSVSRRVIRDDVAMAKRNSNETKQRINFARLLNT